MTTRNPTAEASASLSASANNRPPPNRCANTNALEGGTHTALEGRTDTSPNDSCQGLGGEVAPVSLDHEGDVRVPRLVEPDRYQGRLVRRPRLLCVAAAGVRRERRRRGLAEDKIGAAPAGAGQVLGEGGRRGAPGRACACASRSPRRRSGRSSGPWRQCARGKRVPRCRRKNSLQHRLFPRVARGAYRSRTGVPGFADPCLTTRPRRLAATS